MLDTDCGSSTVSIYYEALWVLVLFGSTACLREAVGELCTHKIARNILSCSHVSGKVLDTFASCSNSGRSLGFGAAWRMWNIDPKGTTVRRWLVLLPFMCWIIGLPIKLIAVEAVRGGNSVLGYWGTWALGILWITFGFSVKAVAIATDRVHGLRDKNGKIVSFRRIFQLRVCSFEGMGMILQRDYNEFEIVDSFLQPKSAAPLGLDINWEHDHEHPETEHETLMYMLKMTTRRGTGACDPKPNGLEHILKNHPAIVQHEHIHRL